MNEEEKKRYLERYKEKKADGELFFPHAIAKDAVVSLGVFILLLCLVVFVGIPEEPPANPADTSYIPRPEWYFLWAFQALKYFPGQLEGVAIMGMGLLIAVGLFGLPFYAGWGLTDHRGPALPRRQAHVALEGLVHAALHRVPGGVEGGVGLPGIPVTSVMSIPEPPPAPPVRTDRGVA